MQLCYPRCRTVVLRSTPCRIPSKQLLPIEPVVSPARNGGNGNGPPARRPHSISFFLHSRCYTVTNRCTLQCNCNYDSHTYTCAAFSPGCANPFVSNLSYLRRCIAPRTRLPDVGGAARRSHSDVYTLHFMYYIYIYISPRELLCSRPPRNAARSKYFHRSHVTVKFFFFTYFTQLYLYVYTYINIYIFVIIIIFFIKIASQKFFRACCFTSIFSFPESL